MKVIRVVSSLVCVFTLIACMASQASDPTSVPSATQVSVTQLSATELTQPAPTAAAEQATTAATATRPTAAASMQATSASHTTTPAPTSVVGTRVLKLEEPRLQGDDVRAVQQRLQDLGYSQVGTVDGIFGPQTEAAVSAFQRTNALQVDGVVGPQTRTRLFSHEATVAVVPIVVHDNNYYLLGGVQAGAWLEAPAAAPLLSGGDRYRVVVEGGSETTAIGSKPAPIEVICTKTYTVSLEPGISDDALVAVGGSWQLQPRIPTELAKNDPSIQQAVATFLQTKGIKQPDVHITRALAIDLEGDASDEVVVTATRLATQNQDPTDAAAGDYSFVGVHKIIDGKPTMVELAGNYFPQAGDFVAPNEYRLLGVLDLDGDGVLEIVINGAYYEGAYTSALRIENDKARVLLSTGCGV
jgi:Putative peptidoglycan binding domain